MAQENSGNSAAAFGAGILGELVGAELSADKDDLFPLMPEGEAVDMGYSDGVPLVDPRIFDSPEFFRNPYPYYRILRDHYPVFS